MHNILVILHNILRSQHARHYIWELSKILVPALLTGLITFTAMRIIDNKNKKRWLTDGHIKRKTELEIEIRKFMLGIKINTSDDYEGLADWNKVEDAYLNPTLAKDFNESFETLFKYFQQKEKDIHSDGSDDKMIFTLMDEYICYAPKTKKLFEEFKALYKNITKLKSVYQDYTVDSQGDIIEEIEKDPEHFDEMVNTYLCLLVSIDRILKKLVIPKI